MPRPSQIRIGIVGYGYRGRYLHRLLEQMQDCHVIGVTDPQLPEMIPSGIQSYGGACGYRIMLAELSLDLVVIASPWHCHIAQAMDVIAAGVDVAIEIRGGACVGEYQPLMAQMQRMGRRVFPLENTVFMRECMAVRRMVEAGVFGQLVSLSGGYRHDLRPLLWGTGTSSEHWRSQAYRTTNADLYPTHGLGPIALCVDLGRSNPPTRLVSVASRSVGVATYCAQSGSPSSDVCTGDVITTLIETQAGMTIRLMHDTTLPRPRSLDWEIQGTRAIWQGEHRRIYIEGVSPHETWEDDAAYMAQYDHPLWVRYAQDALASDVHHRGMDFVMLRAVLSAHRREEDYPITLSDLALWTSVTPLSARSIALAQAVAFPSQAEDL